MKSGNGRKKIYEWLEAKGIPALHDKKIHDEIKSLVLEAVRVETEGLKKELEKASAIAEKKKWINADTLFFETNKLDPAEFERVLSFKKKTPAEKDLIRIIFKKLVDFIRDNS